jgi:HNH endonuclease
MITALRLRTLLIYSPETGKFTRRLSGNEMGWLDPRGYWRLQIEDVRYWAHRLAWFYVTDEWPTLDIDHINGDRSDNRWTNLRLCTMSENLCNRGAQKNNTTGLKGVSRMRSKFQASIAFNGDRRHLGTFESATEAHRAYCQEAIKLHGKFVRFE